MTLFPEYVLHVLASVLISNPALLKQTSNESQGSGGVEWDVGDSTMCPRSQGVMSPQIAPNQGPWQPGPKKGGGDESAAWRSCVSIYAGWTPRSTTNSGYRAVPSMCPEGCSPSTLPVTRKYIPPHPHQHRTLLHHLRKALR